jgi:Cytochrome c554 and c-prime
MPWLFGRSIRGEARSSVRSSNISIGGATRSLSAVLCFCLVLLVAAGGAQESSELPGSTEDHAAAKGWWPTKTSSPGQAYAGESTCGKCHSQECSSQANTSMAKAAFRLSDSPQSAEPASGRFESGPYSYGFVRASNGWSLEVESRGQSISSRVLWTFGAGVHGTSYILEGQGELYESQVSSFSSTHALDLTPGHTKALEGSLQKALGNHLSTREATQCFACHTTAWSTRGGLDLEKAVPGVHCEACHGPGIDHIHAAESHPTDRTMMSIFNPAHLTPLGSVDFCGSCHRTTMDVVLNPSLNGLSSIRFQPYRLQKSRCWEKTEDARLTCTACHNPHEPLVRSASSYDQKCLSCHSSRQDAKQASAGHPPVGSPSVCPKATTKCVSCHMPKYNLPEMHSQFTDHFIRIVRPGELYPN